MLRPWVFVGFTGHRKLADPGMVAAKIEQCWRRIGELTHQAPPAAVSSAAIGADTLFIQSAREHKFPWTLLLPFPAEIFTNEEDFPEPAQRRAFQELAGAAIRKVVISEASPELNSPEQRGLGFLECGLRTVEECDILIAVWDGLPPRGVGGTSRIVAYARELKRPILWIHAVTGEITEEISPANFQRFAEVFPPTVAQAASPSRGFALLDETFQQLNEDARTKQPFAKYLTMTVVGLHQTSIAAAIIALIWVRYADLQDWAGWFKVGALLLAMLLPWLFHHAQSGWMNCRLQAEMCRSARAVWNLQHPENIFPELRLPAFSSFQRSLLLLRLQAPPNPPSLPEVQAAYAETRLQDQADYYTGKAKEAARNLKWTKILAYLCTGVAVIYGIVLLCHVVEPAGPVYKWVKLFALTLPLVTTGLIASITAHDMERRAARYREMAETLTRAKIRLNARATWAGVAEIVVEVERSLLLEIWEWYSVSRYSASH